MVRIKIVLNKLLNYFTKRIKRKKINNKTTNDYDIEYILTKEDYRNEDILDQLFESNSYE